MTTPQAAVAMLQQEPSRPHIEFFLQAVEDRDASIRHGHYVAVDEEWCRITPRGSNGKFRKVKAVDAAVREKFAVEYEAWKKGVEPVEEGTLLRNWPPITPAQLDTCHAMHVYTVEQLAQVPEEGIAQMAHGRALKSKAQTWLHSAENTGKVAEELTALRIRVEELDAALTETRAANERLRAELGEDRRPRGRRR